jgi:hypothetical protein
MPRARRRARQRLESCAASAARRVEDARAAGWFSDPGDELQSD